MDKRVLFGVVLSVAVNSVGKASYILSLESGGSNSAVVRPGQSIDLDVMLSSDAGDQHNSAIFRVVFSAPGIAYTSYSWMAPYTTGSIFDDSKPFVNELPVTLDDTTLTGPGYPPGVVDVELSNVVEAGFFSQGLLARLSLTVPVEYRGAGTVFIQAVPDTFANGFEIIRTTQGSGFQLIIPAPPGIGALALLGCCAARIRRRRAPSRPAFASVSGTVAT